MSAINLRANMTWADSGRGFIYLTYSPSFSDLPGSFLITFVATDSVYDTTVTTIQQGFSVGFVNVPPVLAAIGPKTVMEGDSLIVVTSATDANGTTPIMSASNLPAGASFVNLGAGTGRFRFLTNFMQAGTYFPLFRAQDATTSDTERVQITVLEAGNHAPTFITVFPTDTIILSTFASDTVHLRATDLDNPLLALSVETAPPNSIFTDSLNNGGLFIFDPDSTNVGLTYVVSFIASDGSLIDVGTIIYRVESYRRGDWNNDGAHDILDVVAQINYTFRGGPEPVPYELGNLNGDAVINILDVIILIDYVFRNGPPLPP